MKWIWIVRLLCLLCLVPKVTVGQYYLFRANEKVTCDVYFAREAVNGVGGTTVFNVVWVKNTTSKAQTYRLILSIPEGFSLLGEAVSEITVNPNDSLAVPVRVAIASSIKGDIGYSIVATVEDMQGNAIKNIYSFLKVPSQRNIQVGQEARYYYFDPVTNSVSVGYKIKNKGNVTELVSVKMELGEGALFRSNNSSSLAFDFILPQSSDTLIKIPVSYLSGVPGVALNVVRANAVISTPDTSFKYSSWVRKMESEYEGEIPDNHKMLIVELIGQGIFNTTNKPVYLLNTSGAILLPKNREVNFSYRDPNIQEYDFDNVQFFVNYRNSNMNIRVGDLYSGKVISQSGRGVEGAYYINHFTLQGAYSKQVYRDRSAHSASVSYDFGKRGKFSFGYAGTRLNTSNERIVADIGFVGYGKSIKSHSFDVQVAASNEVYTNGISRTKPGYGLDFRYTFKHGRFNTNASVVYGSPYYAGNQRGRFSGLLSVDYKLTHRSTLNFYYNEFQYRYNTVVLGVDQPEMFNVTRQASLNFNHRFTPRLSFYCGPEVSHNLSNNFPAISPDDEVGSISYKLKVGVRIVPKFYKITISPYVILGMADFYKYTTVLYGVEQPWVTSKKPFAFQSFNFNAFSPSFGFTASYINGPFNFYQQYAYFYNSVTSRVLRFTPYFNQFFFQKQVYLVLQLNYSNNIDKQLKYSNFTGQLFYYFPKDWSAYFLGVFSSQSSQVADAPESKYSNIYFEVGLKKAFGFPQPRLKYYDLKVVFFKDFNGNRVKDAGEPGVDNVVLSLQFVDSLQTSSVNFSGAELISNQFGEVSLTKIPGGIYSVNFEAIGKSVGTFSKDLVDPYFTLNKDATIYYPFVEKNKVFGSIVLNRSKISALGSIDLSNIRITAQDSKGSIYSALTNAQGKFILFAPLKDNYTVAITNVLYENFDLRQNNFQVHFNGYKQFEVNFVFDEKIRTINFSKGGFGAELAGGVLEIRRTNLRGSVKDANSLKPVVAKVNVINRRNSQMIASITTNRTTGEYSVSFAAGKDYLLEVVSDGYWYFSQNLDLEQITTFEDVIKDISLTSINIGSTIDLRNLVFDSKSSELTPEGVAEITKLVSMLKDNPTVRIQIQGHCDDLEALDNSAIGDARARNVARYLVERGFSKFETKNMGNTVPIALNDTEENRRLNRRVNIVITNK